MPAPTCPPTTSSCWPAASAEAVGGAGLLVPRTQRAAGWWLLATLAAVFPANVHMAVHPERYAKIPRWALLARLPFQLVFGAWVAAAMRARLTPRRRYSRPRKAATASA